MLSVNNLSLNIDNKPVLNQVSSIFRENEIIGITGPPGSGKTAFLRTICRSVMPTAGSISINDINITKFGKKQYKKKVAAYPLNFEYNPDDRVYNFILDSRSRIKKFWESLDETDRQITDETLELFHLNSFKNEYLYSISRTILKRARLAYTFCQDARILILDDPVAGLDIKSIEILYKAVKKYAINNKIIIIASHNLNFISQLADRIIIMHQGKFVLEGDHNILTKLNIRRYFNADILTSKNVYNGKTEIHFFPET